MVQTVSYVLPRETRGVKEPFGGYNMIFGVFVTLAVPTPKPEARPASTALPHVLQDGRTLRRVAPAGPDQLYSLRARRRFAAYLRLRLLEMREAGLERAAAVVEHRLPVDALLPKP